MVSTEVRPPLYIVEDRVVITYEPERWAEGVITGFLTNDNGFIVEHVISFHPSALLRMLRYALTEAKKRNLNYVVLNIPHEAPRPYQLRKLAIYFRFQVCKSDEYSCQLIRRAPW